MYFDQQSYDIRCDWGLAGLTHLSPSSDAIVIIDVLSFSTCVDIAVANGAPVYQYRWRDASADVYAASHGAIAASHRQGTGYSLSPASLRHIPPGTRLVLPSPNGSTLSLSTGAVYTFAGCLSACTELNSYLFLGKTSDCGLLSASDVGKYKNNFVQGLTQC